MNKSLVPTRACRAPPVRVSPLVVAARVGARLPELVSALARASGARAAAGRRPLHLRLARKGGRECWKGACMRCAGES
eukprot:873552-Pleurochrysis_carterae.AAC.2